MPSNRDLSVLALLQRCCEDSCTPDERAYIQSRPALMAGVAALHREDAALRELFAAARRTNDRPSPQELIAYADGMLAAPRRRFVEKWAR